MGAIITGWGKCRPPLSLTNADLEQLVETDDTWIRERTGIESRGMCHLETTDMAEVAARHAMAAAGIGPDDLDLIVVASVTPEITCPSNACVLQERLGATGTAAFDLNAACSGFVYGLATVSSMVAAGVARRALLVGVEKLHFVMDYRDRNTCVLFGDGAGAVIVEPGPDGAGVLAVDLGADGEIGSTMVFETLGTRGELSRDRDPAKNRLHFEGQAVFKIAVKGMTESVQRALGDAGLSTDDVDVVVPHQANERIIRAATSRLGVDESKVMVNIAQHGNTSAASIPMALTDALDQGRIAPGDTVVFTAFGGGVTWGSIVMNWGDRVERIATSDAEMAPPTGDVFDLLADNRAFFAPLHDD
ncbi:MAG: beta-ketoacyl-ACP synthase III [Ilumatobacteraceae bacterium]